MKLIISLVFLGSFIINPQSQNDITITLVNEDTMNMDSLIVIISSIGKFAALTKSFRQQFLYI